MSAFGPKRTWSAALQMSALGGKADMPHREGANVKKPISDSKPNLKKSFLVLDIFADHPFTRAKGRGLSMVGEGQIVRFGQLATVANNVLFLRCCKVVATKSAVDSAGSASG